MPFKKLEIIEPILKAVAAEGYTIPDTHSATGHTAGAAT